MRGFIREYNERHGATVVEEGWTAAVDAAAALVLRRLG